MYVAQAVGVIGIVVLAASLAYGSLLPQEPDPPRGAAHAHQATLPSPHESNHKSISVPGGQGPQVQVPPLQQADDLFFVGRDLWSAATNSMVTPDAYGGGSSGGGAGWPVAGDADRFVFLNRIPQWGFVAAVPWIKTPGQTRRPAPAMDAGVLDPGRRGETGIQPPGRFPGPFLNQDLRRVIYFKDGDLWKAELDWSSYEVTNHSQVTRIGILNPVRAGDISLIAWHENILLMGTRFSQDTPVLRVDLSSGEIEELPPMMVFIDGKFANPSASLICASHRELFACYDISSGDTFRISLPQPIGQIRTPAASRPGVREQPSPFTWLNNETLLLVGQTHVVGQTQRTQHLLRVDFRRRIADELAVVPGHRMVLEVPPGGRHVVAWVSGGESSGVRVGVEDRTIVPLSDEIEADGTWLDESRYVYTRQQGSISDIGVWLYDLSQNNHRRICNLPAASRSALYFPRHNALYLNHGARVLRTDLASGECERLEGAEGGLAPLLQPPLDLRLGVTGDALWMTSSSPPPARPADAAPNVESQVGETTTGAGDPRGLESVLQATEGLSPELREEILQAYQSAQGNVHINHFYHPDCTALAFLEWRQDHQGSATVFFRREYASFAHCVDKERIATHSAGRARQMNQDRYSDDVVDRIADCTGERMAEKFSANPRPNTRHISNLFVEAMRECREPYRG